MAIVTIKLPTVAEQREHSRYIYKHAGDCGGNVTKHATGYTGQVYTGLHGFSCDDCSKRGVKVSRRLKSAQRGEA
jgi:hypothetical protein